VPALDCVYKLQEYAGIARRKHAVNKITWPGRKQVWRRYTADGIMAGDILTLDTSTPPSPANGGKWGDGSEPLIAQVMQGGRRLQQKPSLDQIRRRVKRELERLPEPLRRLETGTTYPVEVAAELVALAAEVDRRMQG
jgi:nicotinate phosphoribosyltransferase